MRSRTWNAAWWPRTRRGTTPSASARWNAPPRARQSRCSTTGAATPNWSAELRMLAPRRRRGFEYLDDPSTPPAVRERSLHDVRVSNTLLGGTHAVLAELRRILPTLGKRATLLDVGTGLAD